MLPSIESTNIYTVRHPSDPRFVKVTFTRPTSGDYSVKCYTPNQFSTLTNHRVGPAVFADVYPGSVLKHSLDIPERCYSTIPLHDALPNPPDDPETPSAPPQAPSQNHTADVPNSSAPEVTANKKRAWSARTCPEKKQRKQALDADDTNIVLRMQDLKTESEKALITIKACTGDRTTESKKRPKNVYDSIAGSIRNMENIFGTVDELLASLRLVHTMPELLGNALGALGTLCNTQIELRNLLMQKYHLGRAAVIKIRHVSGDAAAGTLEAENDAFLCEMYISCAINFRLICKTLSGELKRRMR